MRTMVLLSALFLIAAVPVSAAHYHLKADGTGDYATIQAAVNAAGANHVPAVEDAPHSPRRDYFFIRVNRFLQILQVDICFLCLMPGFPTLRQYFKLYRLRSRIVLKIIQPLSSGRSQ